MKVTAQAAMPAPINYTSCGSAVKIYVGQGVTCGGYTAVLKDLSYPNGTYAYIYAYKNNALANTTSVPDGGEMTLNVSGRLMYISINQTFTGIYAYDRWAYAEINLQPLPINYTACGTFTTVYIGQGVTCNGFTVVLNGLSYPSGSPVEVEAYYNGVMKNVTSVQKGGTATMDVMGTIVNVSINQTFTGIYAYDRWATMKVTT